MTDGDPIVRQIVNKLYGPGDEVLESVVISESQVIVSRETLYALINNSVTPEQWLEIKEALGNA